MKNIKLVFIRSPLESLALLERKDEGDSVSNSDKLRTLFRGSRSLIFVLILMAKCLNSWGMDERVVQIYFSPSCHRCVQIKADILPGIERQFGNNIKFEFRNVAIIDNYKDLLSLRNQYAPNLKLELPIFFFKGKFINGVQATKENFEALLSGKTVNISGQKNFGPPDILDVFKKFNYLGIIAAGLEDGINPCAFTVIVFFISYLALQGYRRRELIVIGTCFILTVFVTYFLVGLGIFNFIYALRGFWLVSKIINISIGILSVILGIFALYDFIKFNKSGNSEEMVLQLPTPIKNRIHALIGISYRRKPGAPEEEKRKIGKLVLSAVITGFLVTLLEAVCTGQLYLPTIVFIFKTTNLKIWSFAYLVLYNILFVAPLFVIFILVLSGFTSAQFANFLKKHMAAIKFFMALLFFALGVLLIWRA